MRVAEHLHSVADMVEDEQGVGKQETGVVYIEFVGVVVGQVFEEAHDIVAEEPDRAAAEAGQVGRGDILIAAQQRLAAE